LLANMPKLRKLTLSGAGVTDAGLEHLASLPQLELLALDQTAITDAGMTHVAKLTQLKYLGLRKTAITDAGLAKLASLDNLRMLNVTETQTTERGLEALQQALPKLESQLVPNKARAAMQPPPYEVIGLNLEEEPDAAKSIPLPSFDAP
jgi:Leucine-rich repeat (LRR) protein